MQLVAPDRLSDEWARVSGWIESALPHGQGDENALDILIAIARGHYALWTSEKLAAVVLVVRWPRQTVLTLLYVGGTDLDAMKGAFQFAKQWGQANGIDVIRTHGRGGWEKVLGLERIGVTLQVKA